MPTVHLTDIAVRQLKSPGIYFDDALSNFGVRVGKCRKTWIVVRGRERIRTKIGVYPAIGLSDARRAAHKLLGTSLEPMRAKAITFEAALAEFLRDHYAHRRARTKYQVKRLLEKHFVPGLASTLLPQITDQHISIELAKLAKTPSEQLHAFRAIRTMLRWCTRPPRRYIDRSPLDGYPPPGQDRKGTRILTDDELAKVWRTAGRVPYGYLVQLLILWGTRNGETGRLRRDWVDGELVTIPGEVTKNGRAHSIPLLPKASAILDAQPKHGVYFFHGRLLSDAFFNDGSWGKVKRAIEERSGVRNWQLRDLRRTFRSGLSRLRVARHVCEILVNHVTGANRNDLDEIYDRYDYLDEKREALQKWEEHLTKILIAP